MKNMIMWGLLLLLVYPVWAAEELVLLTIVNDFDVPICNVYFAPSTATSSGPDRLGDAEVIEAGTERTWEVEPGIYSIVLQDCDNELLTGILHQEITSQY